jgi:hypothetical protein
VEQKEELARYLGIDQGEKKTEAGVAVRGAK